MCVCIHLNMPENFQESLIFEDKAGFKLFAGDGFLNLDFYNSDVDIFIAVAFAHNMEG